MSKQSGNVKRVGLDQALRLAAESYEQGRLGQAEIYYTRILDVRPGLADAVTGLARIASRQGRTEDALTYIRAGVEANKDSARSLIHLGGCLLGLRMWQEALNVFQRTLLLDHENQAALKGAGIALAKLSRWGEALEYYERLLAIRPDDTDGLRKKGLAFAGLGRLEAARAVFVQVLIGKPDDLECLEALGSVLNKLGRYEAALDAFDQALAVAPASNKALLGKALVLRRLGRPHEAIAALDRLQGSGTRHPLALNVRGNLLRDIGQHESAVAIFNKLLELKPADADVLNNRAGALIEAGRYEEAQLDLEKALSIQPGHSGASFNLGAVQIRTGNFRNGWRNFDARWSMESGPRRRQFWKPLWTGNEPLDGKAILLWAEQGYGDTIQFIRYARLFPRTCRVIVEVQRGLNRLEWRFNDNTCVVARGDGWPAFDYHCPLMSLPAAFGSELESIPADIPYLYPSKVHVERWRERRPGKRLRVGLAWSGNPKFRADRDRSMRLRSLIPILELLEIEFVTMQLDIGSEDVDVLKRFPNVAYPAAGWEETTAIASLMDVVIAVDTSIAHLAGAMGVPVWIALATTCDHRWLDGREETPWYPTARLFRQKTLGDWQPVILDIKTALLHLSRAETEFHSS